SLELTGARTAVAVHRVAVVARLAVRRVDVTVPAGSAAGNGDATSIPALGLLSASFRAARAIAVEQAVQLRAQITRLAGLDHAVAAHRSRAHRVDARVAGLGEAGARAAVAADGVAIVAVLAAREHHVAADGHARLSGDTALPAGFDRGAVRRAAVAISGVAVVAGLHARQDAVAAHDGADAGRVFDGAFVVELDLACLVAAVAVFLVAVVALLGFDLLAVAAARRDHGDPAGGLRGGCGGSGRGRGAAPAAGA